MHKLKLKIRHLQLCQRNEIVICLPKHAQKPHTVLYKILIKEIKDLSKCGDNTVFMDRKTQSTQ